MKDRVLTEVIGWLEEEIAALENKINTEQKSLIQFEQMVEELQQYENLTQYKTKFDDINRQLDKEKERLVKLYTQYENKDHENKMLREEVKNWQHWFDTNRDLFDRLLSAAPPKGFQETAPILTTPTPVKKEKTKKKK